MCVEVATLRPTTVRVYELIHSLERSYALIYIRSTTSSSTYTAQLQHSVMLDDTCTAQLHHFAALDSTYTDSFSTLICIINIACINPSSSTQCAMCIKPSSSTQVMQRA